MTLSLGVPFQALCWQLFPDIYDPKKKQKKRKVGDIGPPVGVSIPKQLLDGLESLTDENRTFLEEFMTRDGSLNPLIEKLREPTPDTWWGRDAKLAKLEECYLKIQRDWVSLDARIEKLETNRCELIPLMVSTQLTVNRLFKQMFNVEEDGFPRLQEAAGSSASLGGSSSDNQVFPHPLDSDLMVSSSMLRWPLEYLSGGNKYGKQPPLDELLPEHLR